MWMGMCKEWATGNQVPAKIRVGPIIRALRSSACLPGSPKWQLDFSHTCGDRPLGARYAVPLANEGFSVSTIYITVISADCPALRCVFLEVPFAIASESDTAAPWLPGTYGKPDFPIPRTLLMSYNMTHFVSCNAQSDCTVQGFWWQDTHLLYQRQIGCFQSTVVPTVYPPLNILHVTSVVVQLCVTKC